MNTAIHPLERRQLTIMFCDLVGSTSVADRTDPEDYSEFIKNYRSFCAEPIEHFGGTIARYLGDGLLVYFGFPIAFEDAPCRAVRAGLDIVDTFRSQAGETMPFRDHRIAVRIGIHTGVVVVGDSIGGGVVERSAVFGSAPNIAARLQTEAEPNTVIISEDVYKLLKGEIECAVLGERAIRGISKPMHTYRAIRTLPQRTGLLDSGRPTGELVNRRKELALLGKARVRAANGEGQAIALTGEAGVGKSRLLAAFRDEHLSLDGQRWLTARGSPYARDSDYFAFEEMFRRELLSSDCSAQPEASFERFISIFNARNAPVEDIVAFGNLLSVDIPSSIGPDPEPGRINNAVIQAIIRWLEYESSQKTITLVVEDLHWVDASTYELIKNIIARLDQLRILLLVTTRQFDEKLKTIGRIRRLEIRRLRPADSFSLLMQQKGAGSVPADARDTILKRANGNPLFIEELMKKIVVTKETKYQEDWRHRQIVDIPSTLRDVLMARLDQLGPLKKIAQFAAVLGHRFTFEQIAASWQDDAQDLQRDLAKLIDAGILVKNGEIPEAPFEFKHDLIEETAYDSLLKSDRRRFHEQVHKVLSEEFAREVDFRPEIVARHLSGAEKFVRAFDAWIAAAQASAVRSANKEALSHLHSAELELANIEREVGTVQYDRHLTLQLTLASVLIALVGWAAKKVEDAYRAALSASEAGATSKHAHFEALHGLKNVYLLRGDLGQAYEIGRRLYKMALVANSNELLFDSHRVLGVCSILSPDFNKADSHLDSAISGYEAYSFDDRKKNAVRLGIIPIANAYAWRAWSAWFSGQYEVSKSARDVALKHAEEHLFSRSYALCMAASLAHFDGDASAALKYANGASAIAKEQSFQYWIAWADAVRGWSMVIQDHDPAGLELIKTGIEAYELNGAAQQQSQWLCMLADAHLQLQQPKKTLEVVEDALSHIERTGIAFLEPEFYRLKGEAMFAFEPEHPKGLWMLAKAVRCADRQQSSSLLIKSAASMLPHLRRHAFQALLMRRVARIANRVAPEPSLRPSLLLTRAMRVIELTK